MNTIVKSFLVLVFAFVFADLSFAGFGADIRLGKLIGEDNNFDLYLINTGISDSNISTDRITWYKDYDRNSFVNGGLDIFCEYPLGRRSYIGLKAGYTGFINMEAQSAYYLKYYYEDSASGDILSKYSLLSRTNIKSDAYEIPIAIYYKERISRTFSFFTGAGISFLFNEWTAEFYENTNNIPYTDANPKTPSNTDDPDKIYSYADSKTVSKVIPMFIIGAEARLNRKFSFVFDFAFRYSGKTSYTTPENFELSRDFSGIGANFYFRYYILP